MAAPTQARRVRYAIVAALALTSLVTWTATASATVMKYVDLARLVEISDVVVQGRIVNQQTYLDEEYGHVVTDTTVEVDQTFLGRSTKTVTFQQWGGAYDGKIAAIPGDASFEPYEEVILFLARGKKGNDRGKLFLSALGQSKYTVTGSGDHARVTRDLSHLAFLVETPDGSHISGRPPEVREYKAFVAELRSLIEGIKGGRR